MKILFICKHNRFRSKVAETIFNSLNKNPNIKAESAGLVLDELRPYIEMNVINAMKEKGYVIEGKPKQATRDFVKKFDLIVVVADNLDEKFFSDIGVKIMKWKISDCDASDIKSIKEIINQIEDNVKDLIEKV